MAVEYKTNISGGLNAYQLKCVAIISMLIDHLGAVIYTDNSFLRIVGRLAYPILAFLLVEGFYHTSNYWKYMRNLFVFGLISEVFFDLAFSKKIVDMSTQNVFFTLCIGLFLIKFISLTNNHWHCLIGIWVAFIVATLFKVDGESIGVCIILIFYLFRLDKTKITIFLAVIYLVALGGISKYGILALLFIYTYNGERGRLNKWFFYIFYPVHLFIIFGVYTIIN